MTPTELVSFLGAAKTARDRALFAVCCWTGARLCEALALDVRDVVDLTDHAPGWSMKPEIAFARRATKGKNSGRRVPLHERPSELIALYLHERAAKEPAPIAEWLSAPLFVANHRGTIERLSNRQGRKVFVTAATALGFRNVGSHSGRKSFAQGMQSRGVPLQSITAALGHRDPKHTMRYFGVNDADLVRAVNLLPSGKPEPDPESSP